MDKFDVIIIGAGPGGYVAAIRASQLGKSVALIERQHLGGICLNWGCIPTKSLLKSSEVLDLLKSASDYGVIAGDISFDIKKMVKRSRDIAANLQNGVRGLLKKNKVTIIEGSAKLLDNMRISVCNKTYSAQNIIIATGARARIIKGLEPDGKQVFTYKEAMIQDRVPENLAIIGAGAIGIEFASFYATLGSKVTIIEMQDRILNSEDKEIGDLAMSAFQKRGINILTGTTVADLKKSDKLTLHLEQNGKACQLVVDNLIVAAGVVGNVENLGLENTKVVVRNNQIVVNDYLQTDESNIYAIGDVISPPWLAHKASHEGVLAAQRIAGHKCQPIIKENVPACIYAHPQIARVGLTQEEAIQLGKKIKIGRFPFVANGKALALGYNQGLIKTIFDQETGELLGAHMIGHEVTELICSLVIAKTAELTEAEIMHSIFPHPTLSEMIHESVLNAYDKSLHI